MSEQEEQALKNRRLAELVGFKLHYNKWDKDKQFPYLIPPGKSWKIHKIDSKPCPNFCGSIETCLKWLVPKLPEGMSISFWPMIDGWQCCLTPCDLSQEILSFGKDWAAALAEACLKALVEVKA